ncbi:predicted protein [Postia placenta Mad-698-R]|nr:predicted protein [Postia placenta Mad-698-R]
MTWETPIHVSIDDAPHFLQATAPVLSQSLQSNVHLDASDMSRLQNRSAWMNDSCINACMQLLQLVFLGPGVRADAGDATLWRNAASTRFWEKDDVMQLTARLLNIAADKGHRIVHAQCAWAVYPTTTAARQHNTYDCGVWILAVIAAVLRGYDMTGFEEADIGRFRIFLFTLARTVST